MANNKQAEKSQEEVLRRATPQKGLSAHGIYAKQLAAQEENAQAPSLDTPDERNWVDKQSLNLDETKEARVAEKEESEGKVQKRESENGLYGNTQMYSSVEVEEPEVLGYNPVTLRDRLSEKDEKKAVEKTQKVNEAQRVAGVQPEKEEAPKKSESKKD